MPFAVRTSLFAAALASFVSACSSESPRSELVQAPDIGATLQVNERAHRASLSDPEAPERKPLAAPLHGTVVWTKMSPATNPAASQNVSMTFDSAAGVAILFNGADRAMWTWDGSDWTKLPWPEGQPDPGDRDTEIVFDAARGRVVLYGGFDLNATSGCQRCNDTWEWFGGSWARRSDVGNALNPRNVHSLVYDSLRGVTVLTGGLYGNSFTNPDSDTWEYDGTSWAQTVSEGSGYLPGRREHATSFDSERGVVVLFGGGDLTRATRYSDTWEYDGTAWVQKSPSGSVPSQRLDHAMVFDSVRKKSILYGGEAVATYTAQWEWDGTSWRYMQLGAENPGTRSDHAMTFDPVRKRVVLFGGYDGDYKNDTWEMHVRGNSCVTSDDCHTGFCVDGVCCETACDNACEACSADETGGEDGLCAPVTAGIDPVCDDAPEPDAGAPDAEIPDDAGDADAADDAGETDAADDAAIPDDADVSDDAGDIDEPEADAGDTEEPKEDAGDGLAADDYGLVGGGCAQARGSAGDGAGFAALGIAGLAMIVARRARKSDGVAS